MEVDGEALAIMKDPNQITQMPPRAKRIPHEITVHGDERVDEYYWLRDRDNPDVISYLEEENTYTKAVMAHTEPLQRKLYEEMVHRIQETDQSVPERIGDYYYYTRTEAGHQYVIHCRRRESMDAPEEIILDENQLAGENEYFAVGAIRPSPDHRYLAYSVDTTGAEAFTLYVLDLEAKRLVGVPIPNTYYGVEWATDNRTIFYTTLDGARRPYKLYRHVLGTRAEDDVLVYHETDEAFFVGLYKTRSRRYLMMRLGSHTTTEVRFLDAEDPAGELRVIHPREQEMEYYVTHHEDIFFILTNDNAHNFRLMSAPVEDPGRDNWREIIPHRNAVKLDDVEVFRDHVAVFEREDGLKRIRVIDVRTQEAHVVTFDEPVYTIWAADNPEYDSNVLRFNYTSMVTPRRVYDYDMDTRVRELCKQYEVLGGYDADGYACERIHAAATDGTRIPISLFYRRGRSGPAPLLLYGYGSYGASIETYFQSNQVSLVDRGMVVAIAHIRGGGELGRQWYDRGKLLNKRNTFTDYIACAEHLIAKGYTTRGDIVAAGGSAGGMLVGAVLNMRPDLFRAAIAHVPFVDVLTTMLDETLPLTVIEYEEWGNPNDKKFYEYIRSYSPYDNLKNQPYPHLLVTAGLNDPRVQYWEPAKWVARLRTVRANDNRLLLRTKMGQGHSGASGRYDYLEDVAFDYAFALDCLGITS